MQEIIDVASNVGDFASDLAAAGVKTVIRYYNHRNSSRNPSKCLTPSELQALRDAGLSIAVVFEQRGGAPLSRTDSSHIEDFGAEKGRSDAERALDLARQMEQPSGSGYISILRPRLSSARLSLISRARGRSSRSMARS